MTITDRTAAVHRRLEDVTAYTPRGAWDRRGDHLIRACMAEAAALAGEMGKLLVYLDRGWTWFGDNHAARGTESYEAKHTTYMAAMDTYIAAQKALRDALTLVDTPTAYETRAAVERAAVEESV